MFISNLCGPAILYIGFSLIQIIIDTFRTHYNVAFVKFCVSIFFTILLQFLCERGLGIISWFIVFIPFILMTKIGITEQKNFSNSEQSRAPPDLLNAAP